jgi:hypothetical protein
MGERSHLALLVMHHIASDGWSIGVLAREMTALYEARRSGRSSSLGELPVQYADWAIHERAALAGGALAEGMAHWAQALAGVPGELELPADRPAASGGRRLAARQPFALDAERAARAHGVARAHRATLFMVLLAGYAAALRAEGCGDDLVIGCPAAGRDDPALESSIGFFVNTLPLRLRVDAPQTLGALVERAREQTLAALAHRRVPFARIAEAAGAGGRIPASLGQLWFVLQNGPPPLLALGELHVEPVSEAQSAQLTDEGLPARYDLKLELLEEPGGAIRGCLEYRVDRFDRSTVQRLVERFGEGIDAMAREPDLTLGEWRRRAIARAAEDLVNRRRGGLARLRARPSAGG